MDTEEVPQRSTTNHQFPSHEIDVTKVKFLQRKSSDEEQIDTIFPGYVKANVKYDEDIKRLIGNRECFLISQFTGQCCRKM